MFQILGFIAPLLSTALNGSAASELPKILGPAVTTGMRTVLVVSQFAGQYIDEGIKFVQNEVGKHVQK